MSFPPTDLCEPNNKREKKVLDDCVQMSLRYILYIGFYEGPLDVEADPSNCT